MIYQPYWFWNHYLEEDKPHAHLVFKPTTTEKVISWFTVFISFLFIVSLFIGHRLCIEFKQTLYEICSRRWRRAWKHLHYSNNPTAKVICRRLKTRLSLIFYPSLQATIPNNFCHLQSWNSWTRRWASDGRQWLLPWSLQRFHYSMFGNPLTPGRKWMYYECPADGSSSLSAFPPLDYKPW